MVSWLTEELIDLGETVTLFASGGSKTRAELVAVCPKPLRLSRPVIDPMVALATLFECVAERAHEFDVIHCRVDWIHLPLFRRLKRPFITTLHDRLERSLPVSLTRLLSRSPTINARRCRTSIGSTRSTTGFPKDS